MVKEESMMFVPKATPGAQKILEEYLRKNKLEAHQLSPEQRNELQQILLAEGITSEKIAEETLKVRFCPIAEPMGGKLEFFSDHAMVTFVDEDDPMRINFIGNGLTRDAKNPGIADLRWKLCELEKQYGADIQGDTVWNAYRDTAYALRSFDWNVPFELKFFGDFFLVILGRTEERYEMTWKGVRRFKTFAKAATKSDSGLTRKMNSH